MEFKKLLQLIGRRAWFDLPTLVQLTDEPRQQVQTQLHRWCKTGKLLPLRRGMYAFAEEYRRAELQPAELANQMYSPSYISLQWALSYYGLIPEKTVTFTSVTTKQTKRFTNDFGTFVYRHLKPEAFFGYHHLHMGERPIIMALPEKALLDLWYLEPGRWTSERMTEMRFQNPEIIDLNRLAEFADRLASPRLHEALQNFKQVMDAESAGTVEL